MASNENGLLDIWKVYRKNPESQDGKLIVSDMKKWETYYMFVNTCVYQMIPKNQWKRNYLNANLSTYVTIADESFTMLVLENMYQILFIIMMKQGKMHVMESLNREQRIQKIKLRYTN